MLTVLRFRPINTSLLSPATARNFSSKDNTKVRYTTHRTLRTKLRQIKKYNSQATVLGLDIGRKYTGVAISCKELILAKGVKTLMMPNTPTRLDLAQKFDTVGLLQAVRNIIKNK